MQSYLLVASRDPFTTKDAESFYAMAADLAGRGHPVTLFLVQNGVLPARRGPAAEPLTRLSQKGVRVLAEEFSLRERGIATARLAAGIEPSSLDAVVDALAEGARALWS